MSFEIIDFNWYTSNLGTIGVVRIRNRETKKIYFKIGKALDDGGTDIEKVNCIANHGADIDVPELIDYLTSEVK